jgi:hypothetical protein
LSLLTEILGNLGIGGQQALALALLLPFFPLLLLIRRRILERGRPPLRAVPGYAALQEYLGRSAESGQTAHVSMGTGGVGTTVTAESLAGLTVLEHVAEHSEATGLKVIATVSDPSLFPAALDVMREAYEVRGYPLAFDPASVRFISPNKAAYAAGVMEILGHADVGCNLMVGSFEDEFLLMSEAGARSGVRQVGGTTSPLILPFVYASVDHTVLGEEIFAAGAYLRQRASHLASLATQDWLRTGIILAIVIGVILRSLA